MIEKGDILRPLPLFIITISITCISYPSFVCHLVMTMLYTLYYYCWTSLTLGISLGMGYFTFPFPRLAKLKCPTSKVDLGDSKRLRVLTYNLFMRPPFVKNNQSDYKEIRLEEFLKKLDNYDVIALQELFALGSTRQHRLINYARQRGFFCVKSVPPPLFSRKFIDAGLLILSRFPIVEFDAHIYKAGSQIDSYAAKQVIYTKLQLTRDPNRETSTYLHLFTTHMQASYNENTPKEREVNDQSRKDQIREMIEFVYRKVNGTLDTCLVTGDFNVNAKKGRDNEWEESEEYLRLMGGIMEKFPDHNVHDLLKVSYGGQHPCTYSDVLHTSDGQLLPREVVLTNRADFLTQECIDYLLLLERKKIESSKKIKAENTKIEPFFIPDSVVTQTSDHYGVSTELLQI